MNLNADLLGRHVMRMAASIEELILQRDALAEENDKLRKELEGLKAPQGPRVVPPQPENGVDDVG